VLDLLESYHGLGLRVEGTGEIGSVVFFEADSGSERMSGIVLEDATGGVVEEEEAVLAADVGESEGSDDVGSDCLDLVGLAPVDVGAARDTGGVEYVGGLDLSYVLFEGGPVLETARGILEGDGLGLAEGAEETTNPARTAVDKELDWVVR